MQNTPAKANLAPQPDDWAGEMGARWLANIDRFESMIASIGAALLSRAAYQPGERVVDIGCGGGATSLAIANRVGPAGSVLGIDISPDLTSKATQRAIAAQVENARFVCADAATYQPSEPFDRLFSRFGSMFFEQPGKAFANLHAMLKPGGRIDLAVWGPPRDNLWMMEMMGVLRQQIEVPAAIPRAPGPFAFEDTDYLQAILAEGGFSDMSVEPLARSQPVGGEGATAEDAVRFAMSSLAAGRLLQDSPPTLRQRVEADLLQLFTRHYRQGEGVMMASKVWLVTALA